MPKTNRAHLTLANRQIFEKHGTALRVDLIAGDAATLSQLSTLGRQGADSHCDAALRG